MSSLLDALHVSPAVVRRKKAAVQQLCRDVLAPLSPKMTAGVRVTILLLDGRKLEVGVSPRLHTRDLLALAASHCCPNNDTRYFSLAHVTDKGVHHWLSHDRRLWEHETLRQMGTRAVTIAFLVKFYPNSISELRGAPEVELFYQHARQLLAKDQLCIDSETAFELAALALQASYGDFLDTSVTHSQLKKSALLPSSVLHEHPSLLYCEERVASAHKQLLGLSRGDSILRFMKEVEQLPTYGIHFFDVTDRNSLPWYIGISNRGIAEYDYLDKRKPKRVFLWRQLENIYFRERKFSIEVHDPRRVCVSRKSIGSTPASVVIYIWFAESQTLCKAIWSMAIAQHQFYLDRKTYRSEEPSFSSAVDMPEVAVELSRSCLSLSTHSSCSNLSYSGSHSSLHHHSQTESGSSESLEAARQEMLEALKLRRAGLQEKLSAKTEELRLLCLREGELTGELPPEYPVIPGQPAPTVRKRVGTSFALDETIINKIINKQEETVSALELEYEIMAKITSAALKLANESTARKNVRRQRKLSYQQSAHRLRELELKLKQARSKAAATASTLPKQKKKPRPLSESEGALDDPSLLTGGSLSSSTGGDSPRDASVLLPLAATPAVKDILMSEHSSRPHRERSPQLSRSSAPASPHRGASNSTLNSCSRNSSPSRPTRFGSLDRRVNNMSQDATDQLDSSIEHHHQTTTTNTPPQQPNHPTDPHHKYYQQQQHLKSGSTDPHPVLYNSSPYPNTSYHCSPQVYPQQQQQLGSSHRNNYNVSSKHNSALHRQPQSPTMSHHNVSSNSIGGQSYAHNTTVSSIGSTSSGSTAAHSTGQVSGHSGHSYSSSRNSSNSGSQPPQLSMSPPQYPLPPMHATTPHGARNPTSHGQVYSRSPLTNDSLQQHTPAAPPPQQPPKYHNSYVATPNDASKAPHQYQQNNNNVSTPQLHYLAQPKYSQANTPQQYYHTPVSSRVPPVAQMERPATVDPSATFNGSCNTSFDTRTSGDDTVDSSVYRSNHPRTDYHHNTPTRMPPINKQLQPLASHHSNHNTSTSNSTTLAENQAVNPDTVHTFVRTPSGRSYMETTFIGDSSSSSSTTSNQENIPPLQRTPNPASSAAHLPPLRPTSHLRASSSVTPADMAPPRLLPAADLIPLRATKSSSELPPLRATIVRSELGHHTVHAAANSNVAPSEPLMTLAEAARQQKLDNSSLKERDWYETSLDSPANGRKPAQQPQQSHNSCAGESVYANGTITQSNSGGGTDGSASSVNGSLNSTLKHGADLNTSGDSAMLITAGTYQPSREESKPFEMSDFYKYSTKFRKQQQHGSSSSNSSFSNSTLDSSPVLPPRAQVVVSSNKTAPPSPSAVAQHSLPAAQQKGVYQSLVPLTCQGVGGGQEAGDNLSRSTACPSSPPQEGGSSVGPWGDDTPLHQAVPASVTSTNKRSATLV